MFLDEEAKAFIELGFTDVLCRYVNDTKILNGGAEDHHIAVLSCFVLSQ